MIAAALADLQSAVHSAGPQASRIESLWWTFAYVCVAVYVIVIALLFVALVRARRNEAAIEGPDRSLTIAVSSGAGLTLVTLIVLLTLSVRASSAIGHFANEAQALEIDVTGHQWWWEITYPSPSDPSQMITTANEIHVPTGQPVMLKLATRDVIHSLWIPNLHGKRDLIPGRENTIRLRADRAGIYRAQCAEYCGTQHAHMALVVIAEPPAQFAQWQTRQRQTAPEPTTELAKRGRDVFLSLPCVNCHSINGTDAYATLGPDLTHVMSRRTLAAGTLVNGRGALAGWIQNPQALKPGNQMPLNVMTSDEMNALLAYLETLQ